MLVTQDAEGISIDFGDISDEAFRAALEYGADCFDGWDGEPRVFLAALHYIIDEIVSEAMGPTQ
jgi:hypothetical protein